MTESLEFFATAAKGIEPILAEELKGLGAAECSVTSGGVRFKGVQETALRACLWSRTANRVFLRLARAAAGDRDAVYRAALAVPWEEHLAPRATFAVDFTGTGAGIDNTMYGAQLVKDAVADRLREKRGARPSVDPRRPDLLVHAHLSPRGLELHLDLSGEGLHLRGYRREGREAPLRETLAAAILLKGGWPGVAVNGGTFLDPLCGSGTLVIEAALIAADIAPGLNRTRWGFGGWTGFDRDSWGRLVDEANGRREAGLRKAPPCMGSDADGRAVMSAKKNARRAGVELITRFEKRNMSDAGPPPGAPAGLIMTNPPYGKRMGDDDSLPALYEGLGDMLKKRFAGWSAGVFTAEPSLGKRMGLRAHRTSTFYNGPIRCSLIQIRVEPARFVDREALDARAARIAAERAAGRGAEPFLNRLRKNVRSVGKWARRQGIECYRVYDADVPEFAVAIDLYGGRAHVQEYAAPSSVDPARSRQRMDDILALVPGVLGITPDRVVLKVRRRQKGKDQYGKMGDAGRFIEVKEGPCRLLVNLTDYLDTGLFPGGRLVRAMIGDMAKGGRFLNLFCYTAAATAHAALGGARSSVSVDMSANYLEWARRNLDLNGVDPGRHLLVRDDCLSWIEGCRERFDLIFLEPPTFSNSKRMRGTLDIQRDHARLIVSTARLLADGGTIIFSTNKRNFKLDGDSLRGLAVADISRQTLAPDYKRSAGSHCCLRIAVR